MQRTAVFAFVRSATRRTASPSPRRTASPSPPRLSRQSTLAAALKTKVNFAATTHPPARPTNPVPTTPPQIVPGRCSWHLTMRACAGGGPIGAAAIPPHRAAGYALPQAGWWQGSAHEGADGMAELSFAAGWGSLVKVFAFVRHSCCYAPSAWSLRLGTIWASMALAFKFSLLAVSLAPSL